jgi:hypothetical protein
VEFMKTEADWSGRVLTPVKFVYHELHDLLSRGDGLRTWLVRDHLLFFVLASLGALLLAPRFVLLGKFLLETAVLGAVERPNTEALPYFPNMLVPVLGLFLLTFFVGPRWRMIVLVVASLPLGLLVDQRSDLPSIGLLLAFLVLAFGVIKLPIRRTWVASLIGVLSLGFMVLCNSWSAVSQRVIAGMTRFQVTFLPFLWYSSYEELPPRRSQRFGRFLLYHYGRFFGAPVMRYDDLYGSPSGKTLSTIRFGGIKALYVALYASWVIWAVDKLYVDTDVERLSGLSLWLFSYLRYVAGYCEIVILFNFFIGTLRLFGVPVRDNFNYWLLARTPNEHWRRWNILFREWIITVAFFPIMRTKKWLFVAIMVSLLASGMLHIAPRVLLPDTDYFQVGNIMTYWTLNGLAIYAVVKIPQLFPRLVDRLHFRTSRAWWVVGIVLTSAFYSVIFFVRENCRSWEEVVDYISRLC